MKKRFSVIIRTLAILCALALLTGCALFAKEEDATSYQVGYSKKDINPWVTYQPGNGETLGLAEAGTDGSKYITEIEIDQYDGEKFTGEKTKVKFVKILAAGDGSNVSKMVDDNGDGYIGYGDGIFTTCTSVTDSKGKTVFYITVDGLKVYGEATDIRNAIIAAMREEGVSVDDGQIMISASHAHASPSYSACKRNSDPAIKAYFYYAVEQMKNAAVEAYKNRTEATMSKGQISATASMAAMGYKDDEGNGWRLNFSRHYNVESSLYTATVADGGNDVRKIDAWEKAGTINRIVTPHSGRPFQQSYNGKYPTSHAKAGQNIYDIGETVYTTDSDAKYLSHVSEADDMLYVLQFTPSDETKNPIVMINWRAHATMNGSGSKGLSSDFINALRYRLENNKAVFGGTSDYCVGFWQGAAGNITASTSINAEYGWRTKVTLSDEPKNNNNATAYYTARYGYLLALVSLDCLDSEMSDCIEGSITTKQAVINLDYQVYSDGLKAAANSPEYIIHNGSPFAYTHTDGKTYVVNSTLQGNQILKNRSGGTDVELNVIALGPNVAMVVFPGEPFDRYSDKYLEEYNKAKAVEDAGGATVASQWNSLKEIALADNDWLDLVGDTYGTPFVLGYSTQDCGYLAEAFAYDYNTFGEDDPLYKVYGPGSYEGNTAYFAKGSGEAIIDKLGEMLKEITD